MKAIFEKIWELALPYQDQRDDPGHAEVSLGFARELVKLENGNEDVIIPAIILHDVGWSQLVKERRMLIFDKDTNDEDKKVLQLEHEREGVRIAREILQIVNYPEELIPEILEIISGHDTRKGFISRNEGLTRDADKLWRTSQRAFAAGQARRKARGESSKGNEPEDEKHRKKMEEDLTKPDYFYSDTARRMAIRDFKLRMQERVEKE
jgi:HD superfamily phosphodiesterase